MMRIRSDRVRRSSEPMKINKVLVHHSDRNMLPVDDDPTQTPRIRNPDFLHSDHVLPPEPGTSHMGAVRYAHRAMPADLRHR